MHKKDFPDLEDQIKDTVKEALDAIDFVTLKKNISGKTEDIIDSVKKNIQNPSQQFNEKKEHTTANQYRGNINRKIQKREPMYISKKPVGRVSGIVYSIIGAVGVSVISILFIVFLFVGFLNNSKVLGTLLVILGLNLCLISHGKSLRKRVNRFNRYASLLVGEHYCSIKQLSSIVNKNKRFVIKDLKEMIGLGMFKEAYINEEETYFILSKEVYKDYLLAQEELKNRNLQESKKDKRVEEKLSPQKEELTTTIEMVKDYIEQIKNVKCVISKEEISIKLQRLQDVVNEIIKCVEKEPKKLPEVRKFTTHYLPITLKLVNGYKDLTDQPVEGDNIKKAKNEIEKSIDIINVAFEKVLDDLFEDLALDVSTDISVLETLFTQDGLTKNDFEK